MPSLKSLKTRISSVKSTRKITQAMKIVSAAKLKKSKDALEHNRPYTEELRALVQTIVSQIEDKTTIPILFGKERKHTCVLVVIGSDRGLCGSFNNSLIKEVKTQLKPLKQEYKTIIILCIGSKIYDGLKSVSSDIGIQLIYDNIDSAGEEIELLVDNLLQGFKDDKFDTIKVYSNKFINAMRRDLVAKTLIPIYSADAQIFGDSIFECEPSADKAMEKLLYSFVKTDLLALFLESSASENGSRMTSMDSATRNAADMIDNLTVLYNRTRQAAVTTELIEIISGAESVKD